jgi:hypothetical protein
VEENDVSVITGFDELASVPEEQITDKIWRRVVSGKQGTMVYWSIKAGARAAAHKLRMTNLCGWSKAQWIFVLAARSEQ